MNNKDLLRPFDLAQAEAGAAICWSHIEEPAAFVGRTANGGIAIRRADGVIETPCEFSLRMKPLFWKEGKPVYAGDRLWHSLSRKWITVERLQNDPNAEQKGHFYSTDGTRRDAALCRFEESPEPLFIFEGKPVNKGDRLWHKRDNCWIMVTGMYPIGDFGDFLDENGIVRSFCYCTWEKPKTTVVRYANVYKYSNISGHYLGELHFTPDDAKKSNIMRSVGIARIEWQE